MTDQTSDNISLQIAKEMLTDRGYTYSTTNDDVFIFEKEGKRLALFITTSQLNTEKYKQYTDWIQVNEIHHIIIIYSSITSSIQKKLYDDHIEGFTLKETQYNITKHYLVPKHTLATNPEDFEKYKKVMSVILSTDPVVRYYNFQIGDIIEIIREDSIDYKIVR